MSNNLFYIKKKSYSFLEKKIILRFLFAESKKLINIIIKAWNNF